MNTKYAQPVKRMDEWRKIIAHGEGQDFAAKMGYKFIKIEKPYRQSWCVVMEPEDKDIAGEDETAAAIVTCPHCGRIQVCWGEYGDPAIEICICTDCGKNYETEPF